MRILAGNLRGRNIKTIKEAGTRPISGRIKKSLFDIIKGLLPGANVLDLYAGTGAVGIEALSRGAAFAFFVDKNPRCVEQIQVNLDRLGFSPRARVHRGSALGDLSWIAYRAGIARFDIIFLGPPYKDELKRPLALTTPTLEAVAAARLLAPGGWLISQHQVRENVIAPAGLAPFRRAKYGDTFLDFLRAPQAPDGA